MTRMKATTKPATVGGRRSLGGIATAAATLMLLGLAPAGAFAASLDGAGADKAASSSSIQASATGSSLAAPPGAGGDGAVTVVTAAAASQGSDGAVLASGTGGDGTGLGAFLAERRGAEGDGKGGEPTLLANGLHRGISYTVDSVTTKLHRCLTPGDSLPSSSA